MTINSNTVFSLIAAIFLTGAASCSDSTPIDTPLPDDKSSTDDVTFVVSLDIASTASRAGYGETAFSDGSHADVLISAVYKQQATGEFTLQPEFQKFTTKVGNIEAATGQNIASVSEWPVQYSYALDPKATYRIVFWAQNSSTEAYEVSDLSQIKANYDKSLNNDEYRDAFTNFAEIGPSNHGGKLHVVLHRPLAQINVGTAGWDYEATANMEPDPMILTKSKITIKGVAQYYNAVTGKALVDNDKHKTTDVTFDYSRMPAFVNVEGDIKQFKTYDNEELLYVKLHGENLTDPVGNTIADKKQFFPYRDWDYFTHYRDVTDEFAGDDKRYPYIDENNEEQTGSSADLLFNGIFPWTEEFKYLSMCYVLVPEPTTLTGVPGMSYGTVLPKITFDVKGTLCDYKLDEFNRVTDVKVREDGSEAEINDVFELNNVPVQKNWRTNIVSNNFFVFYISFKIFIVPDFSGDWDQLGIDDKWSNLDDNGNPTGIKTPNNNASWPEDDSYIKRVSADRPVPGSLFLK